MKRVGKGSREVLKTRGWEGGMGKGGKGREGKGIGRGKGRGRGEEKKGAF